LSKAFSCPCSQFGGLLAIAGITMTNIIAAITNATTTNDSMRLIMRNLLFLATLGGLLLFS
jgi:hypothetical protein